ncbi:MAG: rod shape-determining protein RodA, partial [Bacteroidia bacterium]|nr:rod shape-determining protein RodA [Bacteroidia bacterium]
PVLQSFLKFRTDYSKQFYFFVIGAVIALFILLTDTKFFAATANLWYAFGILLLLLVFPFHSRVKGTESIIRFGGFQFQPAEFCKICVALALAKYLSRQETNFSKTSSQVIAAIITLIPAALTVMQHETGLALVYFAFFFVMYREGLPSIVLVIGFAVTSLVVATIVVEPNTLAIALTLIAGLTIWILRKQKKRRRGVFATIIFLWVVCVGIQRFAVPFAFSHVLQNHQVERIYDLFGKDNPYKKTDDITESTAKNKETESSYNVKQSKIAIGSGGLLGKGLLKGTQTRYDFVPEQRTDFIFCTVGEGFGFAGSFVLLGIYVILLFRIVTLAERQRSTFSRCYAYGVASVFFFHIAINTAMTVG